MPNSIETLNAKIAAQAARIEQLTAENEYIRMRFKEVDLHFWKMLLVMRASVIELEHGRGAQAAMAWIFNTLLGPGEFAPDEETNAQEYFDREMVTFDKEFGECMDFFTKLNNKAKAKLQASEVQL